MKPEEDYLDLLQNIEALVIATWKDHPEMTDYAVLRAYEAALAHYKALARGGTPRPEHLTGPDAEIYAAVRAVCDPRLASGADNPLSDAADEVELSQIPLDDLLACLRRLRKSVERWNRTGGSRGYLEFIANFLE